jgi:2-dehydro-3-deoxyphosphogluconate aldolase/(4S)-4-hydroxy-2-oxoglutarate aldolase
MMGRKRIDVINALFDRALIARVEARGVDEAMAAAGTQTDGGARLVELSIADENGLQLALDLAKKVRTDDPEIILGAGPVIDAADAKSLIEAGLEFISGPFDAGVAKACNRAGVLYLPLAQGPEDITAAAELAVELIRIPASRPDDLAEALAANPGLSLVTDLLPGPEHIAPCLKAGAAVVTFPAAADAEKAADMIWEAARARGLPLFAGVEHTGTYPLEGQDAAEIADWYVDTLGFQKFEGEGYYFVFSQGPGRIEVLSAHEPTRAHMAIKVRHLGEAMRVLQAKGFDFEPVKDFGRAKAVFLKQTDPAGNKVHFLYLALS